MLRDGPIPLSAHGLLEYGAGALLIAAPFLLGFDSDAATAAAIVTGVVVIAVAATTDTPTSLVNRIPRTIHAGLDYALVAFLIAAPFVLDFSDDGAATALFIALGVVHLLVTIGTRFKAPREDDGRGATRRSRSGR